MSRHAEVGRKAMKQPPDMPWILNCLRPPALYTRFLVMHRLGLRDEDAVSKLVELGFLEPLGKLPRYSWWNALGKRPLPLAHTSTAPLEPHGSLTVVPSLANEGTTVRLRCGPRDGRVEAAYSWNWTGPRGSRLQPGVAHPRLGRERGRLDARWRCRAAGSDLPLLPPAHARRHRPD
jgi:hypothetical protein